MSSDLSPGVLWLDLRLSLAFFSRVPLAPRGPITDGAAARALRLAPLAGALIGLLAAAVFGVTSSFGLPALAAALLTIAATLLLTGALHEDGLADLADGLGGGHDRWAKLAIMRDSRLGSFGALALILSVALRAAALAALLPGLPALAGLLAAHALSRALLPALMVLFPSARNDGLAATIGPPRGQDALLAIALGAGLTLIALGPLTALAAIVTAVIAAALVMTLAARHIGGYTGDVLGAAQQIAEISLLLVLASLS